MFQMMVVCGRLARDPVKHDGVQSAFTTFTVATNRWWRSSGGDLEESVEYHDCIAHGPLAEPVSRHLFAGGLALVVGHVRSSQKTVDNKVYNNKTLVVDAWQALERRAPRVDSSADERPPEGPSSGTLGSSTGNP